MVLIFKMCNNMVPEYLCSKIIRNSEIYDYNTRRREDLHRGAHKTKSMSKFIFQSAVGVYNNLDNGLKMAMIY